ncbi:hypothetical protein RIF29_08686 [Crotalaria pallida]|uniref:Uncharacterized protein n=1 Tax=Crotalaria pallida TaxID=3830 RepID=A0AAN9FXC7_CROPI
MSSIGASSAQIFVMRERQKEKMKRMEEEKGRRGDASTEERKVASSSVGRSKKVHPGGEQGAPSNNHSSTMPKRKACLFSYDMTCRSPKRLDGDLV